MDQTETKELRKCQLCSNIGSLACSACRQAFYCSSQHQKEDWKKHRNSCIAFKIIQDDNGSCHAVATRALTPGTIVLEEEPLFTMYEGPPCFCITCGYDMTLGAGMFSLGTGIGGRRCTRCYWPLCGEECQNMPLHAENECRIFKENNILFNPYQNNVLSDKTVKYIGWARALCLKKKDPERWNRLMKTLCRPIPQQQPGRVVVDNNNIASSFMVMDVPDDITQVLDGEWIKKFDKLVTIHGHFMQMKEDNESETKITTVTRRSLYIFEHASQFANCCSANCDWIVGTSPDFKIRIRAAVPIRKGDRLHLNRIDYLERNPGIYGTEIRQQAYLRRYGTPCQCDLCLDPTEFGSFQSALVCQTCKADCIKHHRHLGYLLPQDPTKIPAIPTSPLSLPPSSYAEEGNDMDVDQEGVDPLWQCNNVTCGQVVKLSSVSPQLRKEEERLGVKWLEEKKVQIGENSVPKLLQTIHAYETDQVLHPNHWLIQKAARQLHACCAAVPREVILNLFDISTGITYNVPFERERMLKFHLQCLNKTMPGLNRFRVSLLRATAQQIENRCNDLKEIPLQEHTLKTLQAAQEDEKVILAIQKEILLYYKNLPLPRGHDGPEPCWSYRNVKDKLEQVQSDVETLQEEIRRRGGM